MGAAAALHDGSATKVRTAFLDLPCAPGEVAAKLMLCRRSSSLSETPLIAAPYSADLCAPLAAILEAASNGELQPPESRDSCRTFPEPAGARPRVLVGVPGSATGEVDAKVNAGFGRGGTYAVEALLSDCARLSELLTTTDFSVAISHRSSFLITSAKSSAAAVSSSVTSSSVRAVAERVKSSM